MDWMIGFTAPYTFTTRDYRQYSVIADLHTLQFNVTHSLWFSVITSRILATDLSQSHCHFSSHMKSSFHNLIPFLPLFCNCQFRRRDSSQFLCSQAYILAGWRLETRFFTLCQSQSHIATVSQSVIQSVSLGVKPNLGPMTRYLLLFDSYDLVIVGRPLC
jgi:hypothetical protein